MFLFVLVITLGMIVYSIRVKALVTSMPRTLELSFSTLLFDGNEVGKVTQLRVPGVTLETKL